MPHKNTKDFHLTTGKELLAVKDRLRNLVNHWGEDGRYKEAILRSVIKRFLPEKFSIVTGFVIKQTHTRGEHIPSNQIDIIIYDTSYPTLFKEGDFGVVTADSVRAIIEVKTNLENQKSKRIIEKGNEIGKFIYEGKKSIWEFKYGMINSNESRVEFEKKNKFFNGIFSYEGFLSIANYDVYKDYLIDENNQFKSIDGFDLFCVNHISFNKDVFYKYWQGFYYSFKMDEKAYIYEMSDLSFSYFISNLMDYLSDSIISNSNLWFPEDKSDMAKAKYNY